MIHCNNTGRVKIEEEIGPVQPMLVRNSDQRGRLVIDMAIRFLIMR